MLKYCRFIDVFLKIASENRKNVLIKVKHHLHFSFQQFSDLHLIGTLARPCARATELRKKKKQG
jgi:hypothetical protein